MSPDNGSGSWQLAELRTLAEIPCLLRRVIDHLLPLEYTEKELFGIRLAIEEALVNAVKHGNRNDSAKRVTVRYQACTTQILIEIQDEGEGFDPDGLPDPTAPQHLERPGGRGVFLMRHYMSWVQFSEVGNSVMLCKIRAG